MWGLIVDNIGNIITFVSVCWGVYSYFYYNKISFYLKVNRVLRWRKEVFFDTHITYKIPKDINVFKEIENILKETFDKNIRKETNMINNKIYRLPDFLMKVQLDTEINADEFYNEVFIEFPFVRTTLSHSKEIIDSIDKIDEKIRNKNFVKKQNYAFEIKFKSFKDNPFIHNIVKQFGDENIKKFNCVIDAKIISEKKSGEMVFITKEKIIMNKNSFSEIRRLVPYLLLIQGDN